MQAVKVSEGTGVSEKIGTVTVGERTKKKKKERKDSIPVYFYGRNVVGWRDRDCRLHNSFHLFSHQTFVALHA